MCHTMAMGKVLFRSGGVETDWESSKYRSDRKNVVIKRVKVVTHIEEIVKYLHGATAVNDGPESFLVPGTKLGAFLGSCPKTIVVETGLCYGNAGMKG